MRWLDCKSSLPDLTYQTERTRKAHAKDMQAGSIWVFLNTSVRIDWEDAKPS